ncbi:class I SAM-dependent methyltransferase [Candidatus Pelagibacter sp.]|nr:class I SAM-dependent methyltransferase [Candidatus Pelagibacter sp.]
MLKSKKYSYLNSRDKSNIIKFFSLLEKLSIKHPYLVILILHEYYRSLYSIDPYIKFKELDHLKRIRELLKDLTYFASLSLRIGSYNVNSEKNFFFKNIEKEFKEIKKKTGSVYGPLWKKFKKINNLEAIKLLENRLPSLRIFKNKTVLDAGCGGGRYSYAITKLGAKKVTGIDFGDLGLKIAKKNYGKVKNLNFKKGNVLNLPFKNDSFDVVFSNGVLHHTTNLKKGLSELVRVCKPGGDIWLYLYSTGGIFWFSRNLMNKLMKKIPYSLTEEFLKVMKMPENRFIFMDNWYVPIEQHCSHKDIYKYLKKLNVSKIEKVSGKNKFDLDYSLKKYNNSQSVWGEGEIRLLIKK